MRFSMDASDLRDMLVLANRTVDRKDPVKSCIKLEARKGLRVMSTTGHSGSCLSSKADVNTAGEAIVPASTLLNAVRQCDGDIVVSISNNNLMIVNGKLEFSVLLYNESGKAFPFSEKKALNTYICDLHELMAAMKLISPVADTVHEVDFKGVGLLPDKKGLRIVVMSKSSAAGYTGVVKAKVDSKNEPENIIADAELSSLIMSLGSKDTYDIAISVDKSSVTVHHSRGYTYLPQLSGKPYEPGVILSKLNMDAKPSLVPAGMLAKAIRSVLVMGGKEEDYKGRLTGSNGKLEMSSYSNQHGAAKNSIIIAGDLQVDNWYNFRTLLNNAAAVNPDDELSIHSLPNKHACALVIRKDEHIFWLVSCSAPEGVADVKPKKSAKDVP